MGNCAFGFGIGIVVRRSAEGCLVSDWRCFFVGSNVFAGKQRSTLRHAFGTEALEAAWP